MKKQIQVFYVTFLFLIATGGVYAQQADSTGKATTLATDTVRAKSEKECKQGAIGDLFKKKEKAPKPQKKFLALVLPNISSNPSNGFPAIVQPSNEMSSTKWFSLYPQRITGASLAHLMFFKRTPFIEPGGAIV